MSQQLLKQVSRQKQSMESLLRQRSKDEIRLVSPFTVFAKKLNQKLYSWVAYSIGRPRNIVWGTATKQPSGIKVTYGCSWNNLGIINKLIEIRKKDGYVVVSTYAKDMITERILGDLIVNAYENGTGLQLADIYMPAEDLSQMVLDFLMDQGMTMDTLENVTKISRPLASSLASKPNIAQILSDAIPKDVIDSIHDFVSHSPVLTGALPEECPTYQACEDDPDMDTCEIYGSNFALL